MMYRMTRDEAITRLLALEPELRERGVGALYLYGSTARGEAGPRSDVDLFFDRLPGAKIGLALVTMKHAIEDALGSSVDFGSREGLHPLARADIEAAAVRIF